MRAQSSRRRGAVAAVVAMMLTTLAGFVAFSVDIGMMYNAKGELQRTADASALAAAAMLGDYGTPENPIDALVAAETEAKKYAAKNPVLGRVLQLDTSGADSSEHDVVFGRATYNAASNSYTFTPSQVLPDAVKVRVRFAEDSPNGALPLIFGSLYGKEKTEMSAEAIAMMVPRDIVVTADLSGSTSYDSQLRHYKLDGITINSFDVWAGLPIMKGRTGILNGADPSAPPMVPTAGDDQPATGNGTPGVPGGNPNPDASPFDGLGTHGPRFGWMTGYGANLYPKNDYSPGSDVGLYHIRRYSSTTDPAIVANLTEAGYSASERAALLSSADDGNYSAYRNRVKVLLGLAGWRSNKAGGKYTGGPGDGDNRVEDNELYQTLDYPYAQGSWNGFVDYVYASNSPMNTSQANFRYYYGLKTFIDYLQVKEAAHDETAELAGAPLQPLEAIKGAVEQMITNLHGFETNDQVALAVYATSSQIDEPLGLVYDEETGVYSTAVADSMKAKQPAYYDSPVAYTNMDAGLEAAIDELQSVRARPTARKVILLLTDGHANYYNSSGGTPTADYHGPDYPTAMNHAKEQAQIAADQGIQIFTISVGGDADTEIMQEIAAIGNGYWMHAGGSIEDYSAVLDQIFMTLGGLRPVELIQ